MVTTNRTTDHVERREEVRPGKWVVGLVLVLAACGGSSKVAAPPPTTAVAPTITTKPTTTNSSIDYGKTYLAIAAPANSATTTFVAALSKLGNDPDSAAVQKVATPLADAFQKFDSKILAVKWPGVTETDVKGLVTANGAFIGDLSAASAQNVFSASSWETTMVADESKVGAAVAILRSDLGLPPKS